MSDEKEPKHCDDYINDKARPKCLRKFLLYNRIPAYWKYKLWKKSWGVLVLYATWNGKRIRVTMASRMGDVGVAENLKQENGYSRRVAIEELTDFSDKP